MSKSLIMCVLVLCVGVVQAQKMTVDKVVARVGNSAILYSDVEEAERGLDEQYKAAGLTPERDLFYEALEGLMERKLAYNQALIDSLTIDESAAVAEAGEVLGARIAAAGGISNLEKEHNTTVYDIQKTIEQQMREMYYFDAMQYEVMGGSKVKITPGEVEMFFAKFPADSIPTIPEQYMYGQITRFPANMAQAKEAVRERLMGLRSQVMDGSSKFETLARLYSEDSGAEGTAIKGGLLPPFELEQMDPAWQVAVERLRPGQISEVVETEYGLQIIQLDGMEDGKYVLRYIPMRPKYSTEDLAVGARFLDSLARVIRADSISFEAAARKFSQDAASRENGGIATNTEYLQITQGGRAAGGQMMFKFKKDDFTYNVRDYIELSELKPGEVSDSFSARDLKGNELSKIVKLIEVFPTHEANMADDYLLLEQAAMNAKREEVYQKWLDDSIAHTYIYIDPAYRDQTKWKNRRWLE